VVELNGFSAAARAYQVSRAIADLENPLACSLHGGFFSLPLRDVLAHARHWRRGREGTPARANLLYLHGDRCASLPTHVLLPLVPRFLDSFLTSRSMWCSTAGPDAEWDVAMAPQNEDPKLGARLLGAPVLCATPAYRRSTRRGSSGSVARSRAAHARG
jgi:hypothetical protein